MAHAQLSPSSATRWMSCPGSVALTKDMADTSSKYADEGTDAHELAALCLGTNTDAVAYLGRVLTEGHTVDDDMARHVQSYVHYVRDLAEGGALLVEQRLPIGNLTGEKDAHGTTDALIAHPDELTVADLKYGMGEPVQADNNPQLQIYALAALRQYELAYDFKTVRMVIHQPRLGAVSEWVQTVEELEAFAVRVAEAAQYTEDPDAPLVPSPKGCRWCKAKATCPALRAEVDALFEVVPEAAPEDTLATAMSKVDLVEAWSKAVRAETERRLLAGEPVNGFKLVQGRRGARAWGDKAEAEALLKKLRLKVDEMYDLSLISPTKAEKLHEAGTIGPRQWSKVVELVTQSDGKPSVAPESDKRPALVTSAVSDFDDVTDLT